MNYGIATVYSRGQPLVIIRSEIWKYSNSRDLFKQRAKDLEFSRDKMLKSRNKGKHLDVKA